MSVGGSHFRDFHLGFSISFAATAIPGKEREGMDEKWHFFRWFRLLTAKPATYFFNPKLQRQMLNLTALLITLFTGEVEGAKMRAWTELECEEEGRYKVIWLKKQFEAKLIKCKTRTCKQSTCNCGIILTPLFFQSGCEPGCWIWQTGFNLLVSFAQSFAVKYEKINSFKQILSLTSNILLHQSEIRQQVTTGNHKKP